MNKLKLNYKTTAFIGLAFFSILMLWQVYNTYCPLFLSDLLSDRNLGDKESYIIGIFMACDNIFALILLPLFGNLSDKTHTRFGKRMPYIMAGMILAAIAFPFIPYFYRIGSLFGVATMMFIILFIMHMYRTPAVALMPDVTPKPLRSKANGIINLVGYFGPISAAVIKMFLDYNTHPYFSFLFASGALLLACLLMMFEIHENELVEKAEHDLLLGEKLSQTIEEVKEDKPLSKLDRKNMIILLIGVFVWYMAFNAIESFLSLYCKNVVGDEKISGTVTIVLTISSVINFIPAGNLANRLGRKLSIMFGIGCLIFGFLGSGLISPYANVNKTLDVDSKSLIDKTYTLKDNSEYTLALSSDGTYTLTMSSTANGTYTIGKNYISLDNEEIFTYYEDTFLDSVDQTLDEYKTNAKGSPLIFKMSFFLFVAIAGIGWAMINVNSYPMICELASQKNIGKLSSYYYTAAMLAQSVTPVIIGLIMSFVTGYGGLFYYSTVLSVLAFVVFSLYKENKETVKIIKKGLEAFDQD